MSSARTARHPALKSFPRFSSRPGNEAEAALSPSSPQRPAASPGAQAHDHTPARAPAGRWGQASGVQSARLGVESRFCPSPWQRRGANRQSGIISPVGGKLRERVKPPCFLVSFFPPTQTLWGINKRQTQDPRPSRAPRQLPSPHLAPPRPPFCKKRRRKEASTSHNPGRVAV